MVAAHMTNDSRIHPHYYWPRFIVCFSIIPVDKDGLTITLWLHSFHQPPQANNNMPHFATVQYNARIVEQQY